MAFKGKFLIDHNLPITVCEQLQQKNLNARLSKDCLPKAERAEDIELLLYGGEHNFHIVTSDKGFLNSNTHPCGENYAHRTVLTIPAYRISHAAEYLLRAWRTVTWNKLRAYAAIEVQEQQIIVFRCDGKHLVEEERFSFRPD